MFCKRPTTGKRIIPHNCTGGKPHIDIFEFSIWQLEMVGQDEKLSSELNFKYYINGSEQQQQK